MADTNIKKPAGRPRGFAAMDDDRQREIASQGGQAAQSSGRAHRLTPEERSRGGQHSGGNFANRDRKEVVEIGRKGGQASHGGSSGRQKGRGESES